MTPSAMCARRALLGFLAVAMMALSGCGESSRYLDPYQKPYVWQPTGAPTTNLAAQLVNPRDLIIGRGDTDGDAKQGGLAIERVWQDRGKSINGAGTGVTGGSSGGSN